MEQVLSRLMELGNTLPEENREEYNSLLQKVAESTSVNWETVSRKQEPAIDVEVEATNGETPPSEIKETAEKEVLQEHKIREEEEKEILQAWRREEDSQLEKKLSQKDLKVHIHPHQQAQAPPKEEQKKAPVKVAAPKTTQPAGSEEVDITDPQILQAYEDVRNDNTDVAWMLLGYGDTRKTLKLYSTGTGDITELVSNLKEEVLYGYLKVLHGDTQRPKLVLITFVPESLSGMKKAKANMHKPYVELFLQYFHTQVLATSKEDLHANIINHKLTVAGGANYGVGSGGGSSGGENYSGVKSQAKVFYQSTESQGNGGGRIVYTKGPLTTTPVHLAGRAGITEKYIKK